MIIKSIYINRALNGPVLSVLKSITVDCADFEQHFSGARRMTLDFDCDVCYSLHGIDSVQVSFVRFGLIVEKGHVYYTIEFPELSHMRHYISPHVIISGEYTSMTSFEIPDTYIYVH